MDPKSWLSSATGRRITDQDIADALGVTRKTANSRLNSGFSADDMITVARALEAPVVESLIRLGYITDDEMLAYVEACGGSVETADDGLLALELAKRLNDDVAWVSDVIAEIEWRREHEAEAHVRQHERREFTSSRRRDEESLVDYLRRTSPPPSAFDASAGDVGSLPMVADSSPDHPEEDLEDYP